MRLYKASLVIRVILKPDGVIMLINFSQIVLIGLIVDWDSLQGKSSVFRLLLGQANYITLLLETFYQ